MDNIISDNIDTAGFKNKKLKLKEDYGEILSELISVTTGSKTEMKFHPYLYKTFESFRVHKEIINLRIRSFLMLDQQSLTNLFFDGPLQANFIENDEPWMWDNRATNVIKSIIFETFKNVKKVVIHLYSYEGSTTFSFSLLSFLKAINNKMPKIESITIKVVYDVKENISSLSRWPVFKSIQEQYKQKQFDMAIDSKGENIIIKREGVEIENNFDEKIKAKRVGDVVLSSIRN